MEGAIHFLEEKVKGFFSPLHGRPLLTIFAANFMFIMSKVECRKSASSGSKQKWRWGIKKKKCVQSSVGTAGAQPHLLRNGWSGRWPWVNIGVLTYMFPRVNRAVQVSIQTPELLFSRVKLLTRWMILVVWLVLQNSELVKGATVVTQLYFSPNYQMQS